MDSLYIWGSVGLLNSCNREVLEVTRVDNVRSCSNPRWYQEMAEETSATKSVSMLMGLPPQMPAEGELATTWRKWKKKFEIYLKATRQAGDNTTDDVKTSLLLHAIGSEGQEVYDSFVFEKDEDKEKYDVVLKKFEDYYIPKVSITCERYKFFTRTQQDLEGESIDHYVAALRTLAHTCDFRDIRDSLIRDRN